MTNAPDKTPIARALERLAEGDRLGSELTALAFGQIMRGEATAAQTGALLMGLRVQREATDELEGAVRALREVMVRVDVAERRFLVDTCGTGGGRIGTFNVSTAAAFVAVGAGARVAKHGNRSFTSKCGSADVLEALDVRISVDAREAAHLLDDVGMAFLFAPAFHPAMRHVAPVRRELGVATVMNILGPLANPANVRRQLIGVADPERAQMMAEVLARLGSEHAMVVHATVGMDEIASRGTTRYWEVSAEGVTEGTIEPGDFGLEHVRLEDLAGGDPRNNAARIEALLAKPNQDPGGLAVTVLNAGAALYVAGVGPTLEEGIASARRSLESGAAADVLGRLRAASKRTSTSG